MSAPRRTVDSLLRDAVRRLDSAGVRSAQLDASLLLADALGISRLQLRTRLDAEVAAATAAQFEAQVVERCRRRPLAQLRGRAEFWSLDFEVGAATLAPRPESEGLVERAAVFLRASGGVVAVDIGTGTGCLAIALAIELPALSVHAIDISAAALEVARRNVARHGLADRVHLHLGDLCGPLQEAVVAGSVDAVLSNPPYVARAEAGQVDPEVLWEPASAIFAEGSPEDVYCRVAASAAPFARPGGRLFLELPGTRVENVLVALRAAPGWREVAIHDDLAGLPRVGEYERRSGVGD